MSPQIHTQPGKDRYMVRALDDPAALAEFLASVDSDPDIELIDTIGPTGRPHTAVLAITPDKALSLERRFQQSKQLLIERDRPLSLY